MKLFVILKYCLCNPNPIFTTHLRAREKKKKKKNRRKEKRKSYLSSSLGALWIFQQIRRPQRDFGVVKGFWFGQWNFGILLRTELKFLKKKKKKRNWPDLTSRPSSERLMQMVPPMLITRTSTMSSI